MRAAREASMTISLTKSLSYCGVSKTAWYYARRPRDLAIDGKMESLIMEVAKTRPTYGMRRMAAQLARQLGAPVNRKKVSRVTLIENFASHAAVQEFVDIKPD